MKFLFIVTDFSVGGITSSLSNITSLLVKKGHEVEVLDLPKSGKLPESFDARVKLRPLTKRERLWNLSAEDIKNAGVFSKIKYSVLGIMKKIMNRSESWMRFVFKHTRFDGYDAVIGYRQSPVCFYLAKHRSYGAKSVGFWHGDLAYMGDVSSWDHYVSELDCVACVSDAVREGLSRAYPKARLTTVYNVFSPETIRAQAKGAKRGADGVLNIVSVTRLTDKLKGASRIVEIANRLAKEDVDFDWRVVGGGELYSALMHSRAELSLASRLHFVGEKGNPYPEIAGADLLVLTSESESYGMVVVEALILGVPVVAGYYPALTEILGDGENGIIAENSVLGIYSAVERVATDRECYEKLKSGAKAYEYDPDIAYKQFMETVK